MTGITPFKFQFFRGLPPDEARGQFFGFDAAMNVYIMRWDTLRRAWGCVGFDPRERGKAFLFGTKEGDSFIVSWAPAPLTKDDVLAMARQGASALIGVEPEGHA
jgi:hypothetical protein